MSGHRPALSPLHHIAQQDRLEAVEEIRRVLRPGGRLLVADFQPATQRPSRLLTQLLFGPALVKWPLVQAPCLLEAAGFTDVVSDDATVSCVGLVTGTVPIAGEAATANRRWDD